MELTTELVHARNTRSKKMMVVLHGLGDSMEGYRWLPAAMGWDWMNYCLVNAPDPYFGGYSWYDFSGNPAPGIARSRRLLLDLLLELKQQGFPWAEMVLFGFSQGCLITLETGLRLSEPLGALVGVSGYVHDVAALQREMPDAARQQPVLMTHGTLDPLIPIDPVRRQAAELKGLGLNLTWVEFEKPHTIAGQEEVDFIRQFLEESLAATRQ